MFTVIETRFFARKAENLLTEDEYIRLILLLSENPEAGSLIRNTGGVRKLRLAAKGKGKSGGVRVIHFCLTHAGKVYLLDIYGKGEKNDLSAAEEKELAKLARLLKQEN